MVAKFGARAGAAAFVLGLSVAGPAGFAAAEAPDSESGSLQAAAGESVAQKSPARNPRASTMTRSRMPRPGSAATTDLPRRGSRALTVTAGENRPDNRVPAAKNSSAPAAATRSPALAAHLVAAQRPVPAASGNAAAIGGTDRPASPTTVGFPAAPAAGAGAVSSGAAVVATGNGQCAACWGAEAPSIVAGVTTVVNHVFNATFDWLATFPTNPISDLVGGALVLIRRALFIVPEGVTVSQTSPTSLSVSVNTGSVAYLRHDGTVLQVS